mgnify:CR=1 FL=1
MLSLAAVLKKAKSASFALPLFTILILASFFVSCESFTPTGLAPGDRPPRFELPDLEGRMHTLKQYEGKGVLMNFWASWCAPCVEELPALQNLYTQLKDDGFTILAIGIDDDENALREFARQFSLSFPVLIDKSGTLSGKYRITGVPESFVVGRDGKLIMLPDPADNMPVVKIVGPRKWDTPNVVSRLRQLFD